MKPRPRVWFSAFLFTFLCALVPSGGLTAQQTMGASSSSNPIDQLTGPIALYPDALVFQILVASTDVEALNSFARWMEQNSALKGSALQDAALKAGFDAAYVALAPFPTVVQMMAQKSDWTKALGQAFTVDKNAVFDSIQRLRVQAQAVGNLKTTSQQRVETQTTSDNRQVIVIQPANPQVIYVPTYNPQTVYVAPPPPPSTGVPVAAAAAVGFTAGVLIGSSHNSYYHAQNEYWEHREDLWEDREDFYRDRQSLYQENQDQRQSTAQANQDQRQSSAQASKDQRKSNAQAGQDQRQSTAASAQSQRAASQSQRQSAAAASSRGGERAAVQPAGMSSGGFSGYQSGSATRAQSSRGSSSLAFSRGGGGGGGRRR